MRMELKQVLISTYRAKIVVINSRVIFFFNLSGWATYHFCNRSLPCRLNNSINNIISPKGSNSLCFGRLLKLFKRSKLCSSLYPSPIMTRQSIFASLLPSNFIWWNVKWIRNTYGYMRMCTIYWQKLRNTPGCDVSNLSNKYEFYSLLVLILAKIFILFFFESRNSSNFTKYHWMFTAIFQ